MIGKPDREKIQGCVSSQGASERFIRGKFRSLDQLRQRLEKTTFSQLFATAWPDGTECRISFVQMFKNFSFEINQFFITCRKRKTPSYLFEERKLCLILSVKMDIP